MIINAQKIHEHKNSHQAQYFPETAKKEVLLDLTAPKGQTPFQPIARVFRTAYYVVKNKPFIDFESLIDLQQDNSADMGGVPYKTSQNPKYRTSECPQLVIYKKNRKPCFSYGSAFCFGSTCRSSNVVTESKASGGRGISSKFNKLLVAVKALSPTNADFERGVSAMNVTINDSRSLMTTSNTANLLFTSTATHPEPNVTSRHKRQNTVWKRSAIHSRSGIARQKLKEDNYCKNLWKAFK